MRYCCAGLLSLSLLVVAAAEGAEIRALIEKLQSGDSATRRAAARELAERGAEAQPAIAALTRALRDRDLFVRRFAAEALGKVGPEARSAVPNLAQALNDEHKEVRDAAMDALGKMGTASIQALTAVVKDAGMDPTIRRKAAQGLGRIGLPARGAVPALTEALTGKSKAAKGKKGKGTEDIRPDIATALGRVAKPEDRAAIEALEAVSQGKQKNKALKKAATEALRQIKNNAPRTSAPRTP